MFLLRCYSTSLPCNLRVSLTVHAPVVCRSSAFHSFLCMSVRRSSPFVCRCRLFSCPCFALSSGCCCCRSTLLSNFTCPLVYREMCTISLWRTFRAAMLYVCMTEEEESNTFNSRSFGLVRSLKASWILHGQTEASSPPAWPGQQEGVGRDITSRLDPQFFGHLHTGRSSARCFGPHVSDTV